MAENNLLSSLMNLDNMTDNKSKREEIIKAPFSWAGGKSRSLDKILPLLPYSDAYVEVFGGSGAVLLSRQKSSLDVFNDRYSGVTDFYRVLRDEAMWKKLVDRLEMVLHSREEWTWCKETWKDCDDPIERAARWYYMCRLSFASLNRNFGRSTSKSNSLMNRYCNVLKTFSKIHERMKHVLVENQDWRNILVDFNNPKSVFYLDPPYLECYTGTYKHEMTESDHKQMLDYVFDEMKGFVALSGYDNDLYNQYDWDEVHEWDCFVSIKAMAFTEENNKDHERATRENRKEKLWIRRFR